MKDRARFLDIARGFALECATIQDVLIASKGLDIVSRSGTPILEIGDPQDLELQIEVLSSDAGVIEPGAKVIIEHWGGEGPFHGTVRVVEPSAFLKISALGVEEKRVRVIADLV